MARSYVKNNGSLVLQNSTKIKNFACAECVEKAIENGQLEEGEWFTTDLYYGIHEDIVKQVQEIESLIPGTASNENLLATIRDVSGGLSCKVNCSDYEAVVPGNASASNMLVTQLDLNNLDSLKVSCTDYQQWQIDIIDSMNADFCCRVQCYDYNVKMTAIDADLSNIDSRLTNLENGKVDCSVMSNYVTHTQLSSCGYTTCQGNVKGCYVSGILCLSI